MRPLNVDKCGVVVYAPGKSVICSVPCTLVLSVEKYTYLGLTMTADLDLNTVVQNEEGKGNQSIPCNAKILHAHTHQLLYEPSLCEVCLFSSSHLAVPITTAERKLMRNLKFRIWHCMESI